MVSGGQVILRVGTNSTLMYVICSLGNHCYLSSFSLKKKKMSISFLSQSHCYLGKCSEILETQCKDLWGASKYLWLCWSTLISFIDCNVVNKKVILIPSNGYNSLWIWRNSPGPSMRKWLSSGTIADTSSIEYYVFSQSKATGEKKTLALSAQQGTYINQPIH